MAASKSRDQRLMEQSDTVAEMRLSQAAGGEPTVRANRADVADVQNMVPDEYLDIKEVEASNYVHVFTRKKHPNESTKQYDNEDRVVILHTGEFDRKLKEKFFQLYDETAVIHDPRLDAPDDYDIKTVKGELAKRNPQNAIAARPSNEAAARLRDKQNELDQKEKDLIAKQAELESLQAELVAKAASLDAPAASNEAAASTDTEEKPAKVKK